MICISRRRMPTIANSCVSSRSSSFYSEAASCRSNLWWVACLRFLWLVHVGWPVWRINEAITHARTHVYATHPFQHSSSSARLKTLISTPSGSSLGKNIFSTTRQP